jgi:hypothetical protein
MSEIEQLKLEERIPASIMHELLQEAVNFSGDPDLGLKAACKVSFGDLGAFDYVISTAPTIRAAIDAANTYRRLTNDTIVYHLEVYGQRAFLNLENSVIAPRAALDFLLAVLFRNHFINWPRSADSRIEICLAYNEPHTVTQHALTFEHIPIRFSAPFFGFVFSANDLDRPLKNAEANLHALIQKYASLILAN